MLICKNGLRVRVSETTPSQLKHMTLIHSKYGIKEVSVTKTDSFSAMEKVRIRESQLEI